MAIMGGFLGFRRTGCNLLGRERCAFKPPSPSVANVESRLAEASPRAALTRPIHEGDHRASCSRASRWDGCTTVAQFEPVEDGGVGGAKEGSVPVLLTQLLPVDENTMSSESIASKSVERTRTHSVGGFVPAGLNDL